jgi:hypothetical protein
MANNTVPLLGDRYVAIASALFAGGIVSEMQACCDGDAFCFAQTGDNAGFVDEAVGGADAAAEVGLERLYWKVVGNEAKGGGGGKTGAVLGKQVECRL